MTLRSPTLVRGLGAAALMSLMALAPAHAVKYLAWEAVELPVASGASCGNGTPYRFFVNRTPFTSKTVIIYEGGGACWGQKACMGGDLLSASNPNGVGADYMSNIRNQLSTPFNSRLHPLQHVQTQSWNIVFMPYCTGDVHTGNKTMVYADADPSKPLPYQHRGSVNSDAAAAWLKANLPRPEQLLVTGFSAGAAGATSNYAVIRTALNPKKSALMADAGPLFPAPRHGTAEQYPSLPLHNKIRQAWGLDEPEGLLTKIVRQYPGLMDPENLGKASSALGKYFKDDRFGYAMFQMDGVYSDFSYSKFYPEIGAATGETRAALLNAKWMQDVRSLKAELDTQPNTGYYLPYARDLLDAHCLTAVTFGGTAIKEAGIANVGKFVDNLIDGKGTPMRAMETKPVTQQAFGLLSPLILDLLGL